MLFETVLLISVIILLAFAKIPPPKNASEPPVSVVLVIETVALLMFSSRLLPLLVIVMALSPGLIDTSLSIRTSPWLNEIVSIVLVNPIVSLMPSGPLPVLTAQPLENPMPKFIISTASLNVQLALLSIALVTVIAVSYTHLTLPTIYSV